MNWSTSGIEVFPQPGEATVETQRANSLSRNNQLNTVQPGVFFGKGFGDLPNGLAWLRPFAVTGASPITH